MIPLAVKFLDQNNDISDQNERGRQVQVEPTQGLGMSIVTFM